MQKYFFFIIFILGNILHILFFKLNEVLKIADSFAYLQMAYFFKNISIEGFGNGWFGFLYSLSIAIIDFFIKNEILSSFIINILFFNLLILFCFILGKNYLSFKYNILFLILIFLSPILLNYNIHILSENIYIPLFFILFILILKYKDVQNFSLNILLGLILALLYFTRSEAFIYIGSIGFIVLYLFFVGKISFSRAFFGYLTIIVSFFIFVLPYIFYLHSFTGEWGLTNKGNANLRQASLRGISKMDDSGFEQAVGELTSDNRYLITGFVGGLKYNKPQNQENFINYLLKNKLETINRIKENQIKLYTQNLPRLILGNSKELYSLKGSNFFYKNKLFLVFLFIPIFLLLCGVFFLIKNGEGYLVLSFFSLFLVGSVFFTLFFVLDRYFVIFVPMLIFFVVYGLENLKIYLEKTKYILFSGVIIGIYSLGLFSYYNTFKYEDQKYEVKKIAGEWLKKNDFKTDLKILERFPIVTYYSGTRERWLTPYTSKLDNLIEYAHFNKIDYLVVDSIDFKKYRPDLEFLLTQSDKKYVGLQKYKEFSKFGEKVILYKIQ